MVWEEDAKGLLPKEANTVISYATCQPSPRQGPGDVSGHPTPMRSPANPDNDLANRLSVALGHRKNAKKRSLNVREDAGLIAAERRAGRTARVSLKASGGQMGQPQSGN